MLICNKRKICSKKESCPHALKHLDTDGCCRITTEYCSETIKNRKCNPAGASINWVKRKASNTKVKQPLTQKEAERGLKELKDLAFVETRMSGGKINKNKIDVNNLLRGLDLTRIETIYPDAKERGLKRHVVINSLFAENERQKKLHIKKESNRYFYRRSLNELRDDREHTVRRNNEQLLKKSLLNNYLLTPTRKIRNVSVSFYKKDDLSFTTNFNKKSFLLELIIPKNTILKVFNNHLIVIDYNDKNKDTFCCNVLIGHVTFLKMVYTIVENGNFKDTFFLNGESKQPAY